MDAENYLSGGYAIRQRFEPIAGGWVPLSEMASTTMPNRTKGILVSSDFGTPFLGATQVFDTRPAPRKWYAHPKAGAFDHLRVEIGQIIITRSGTVGRSTLATKAVSEVLVSDDLLRVTPKSLKNWGWIYAYLRAPSVRSMMSGAQYGHIIKHLETSHLDVLPIPKVKPEVAASFNRKTQRILDLRNRSHQLTLDAEARFEQEVGPIKITNWGEEGFVVSSDAVAFGRRRLEATPHNPGVMSIRQHLAKRAKRFDSVAGAGIKVWLPSRFKRIPAVDGLPFADSADLFEINPDITKRIHDGNFGDPFLGRVKKGWLLLSRSGQTCGLNGSCMLASKAWENIVISDHVIRAAPTRSATVRIGYLLTALSHPTLGRPLIKSIPYGSSIPEIDPSDFQSFEFARLSDSSEKTIADLAEAAADERAKTDILERELADEAESLLQDYLNGDWSRIDGKPRIHLV